MDQREWTCSVGLREGFANPSHGKIRKGGKWILGARSFLQWSLSSFLFRASAVPTLPRAKTTSLVRFTLPRHSHQTLPFSLSCFWHKQMSGYIRKRKIDMNKCPNKYLWPIHSNIWIYSSHSDQDVPVGFKRYYSSQNSYCASRCPTMEQPSGRLDFKWVTIIFVLNDLGWYFWYWKLMVMPMIMNLTIALMLMMMIIMMIDDDNDDDDDDDDMMTSAMMKSSWQCGWKENNEEGSSSLMMMMMMMMMMIKMMIKMMMNDH